MSVAPGERRHLFPSASESYTGDRTTLPMAVLNGTGHGPRVFVTAAVHGDELNGIAVCRALLDAVDPATLDGVLVVVPIVNVLGVQIGSRYLPDRRDLNRSFPGSHDGSMAARIARLLVEEVIDGSHVGIDLHTAANQRTNVPQVRVDTSDELASDLAVTFGAPFVLDARLRPGSLREVAGDRGVSVLTYEGGGPLRFDEQAIDVATRGVLRVLSRLSMIPDAPGPYDPTPMVLHESRWLRAERGGLLELHVEPGDHVVEDQPLWSTVSPLGEERNTRSADDEGYVIGATTLPLVQPGQALLHVALPGDRMPAEDDPTDEEDDDPDATDDR
ncbi:succinylglutamate desuccinylase/aspartoacylase family protein [Egicoccus halophilus]|uniref:succinylglutamate desuccinylase/aspartoacylase family protein n=1 Tax=Egicoccus halophilus TaxID=1670830 RepID=UPI0013EECCD0|nr:succinylglutamate desuccinylase/aspartoacylase family protein [Egicoccus halophilus]